MTARTQARTGARVSPIRSASSITAALTLVTIVLLSHLLLLSTFLLDPVAGLSLRIHDSSGQPITPTTRPGEEYTVTLSLFESATLNATACYKFYYNDPQILSASAHPNWMFATVPLYAFENNNRGICGRCLKIRTVDEKFLVVVKVAGDCPRCTADQIELSPAAFYGLGVGSGDGVGEAGGVKVLGAMLSIVNCPAEGVNEVTWPWIPDRQF